MTRPAFLHLDPLPRRRRAIGGRLRARRAKAKAPRTSLLFLAGVLFALLLERLLDGELAAALEQGRVLSLDEQALLLSWRTEGPGDLSVSPGDREK